METIAAIVTGLGEAGVAIVRISGPAALDVADRVFRASRSGVSLRTAPSHLLVHGWVHDPASSDVIDEVLGVVMQEGRSYTGELTVELQGHGGTTVSRRVLGAVLLAGSRMAEPGEFTRRAFLNGRLDLAQAEAVIDLIQARTVRAARVAAGELQGHLSGIVRQSRQQLLEFLTHAEAVMDFPEVDLDAHEVDTLATILRTQRDVLGGLLATAREGRVLKEGFRVVLAGQTNAGKSSLYNALLRNERAIVTSVAGTTRDVLEEWTAIDGYPFILIDTAGVRETADPVERIGVERTREQLRQADLVLLVVDSTRGLQQADQEIVSLLDLTPYVLIWTKSDLAGRTFDVEGLLVSSQTGAGLEELRRLLVDRATGGAGEREGVVITSARHEACLREALEQVRAAQETLHSGLGLDVASDEVRSAWLALGSLLGETVGEDLLDQIFSRFCIGK